MRRRLGPVEVGAIGLGAMPLSASGHPPQERAVATIHAALDAGVTLIDTADAYCVGPADFGAGEELIARALRSYPGDTSDVVVATKGGHTRPGDAEWGLDGSRGYLRRAAEASARRLGVDAVGLYQHHRPDPDTPYEESLHALRELADEGTIRLAGISNAAPDQIRLAREIVGDALVAVQNEFSPDFRSSEPEIETCRELGLAFLPWSPFGGSTAVGSLAERHPAFAEVARRRDATAHQVVLAWMLARAPNVIPIPGSSRPETIRASAAAACVELTPDELDLLNGSA
jgi:aryl-alcohol dehydrogenase-like predicted oxidoreductase